MSGKKLSDDYLATLVPPNFCEPSKPLSTGSAVAPSHTVEVPGAANVTVSHH